MTGLAASLHAAFPDLGDPSPLVVLDVGFRSLVAETPAGYVFRIGRNETAAAGFAREHRLLPALRGRVPIAVPSPRWYVARSATFPYGVLGYPKLPGVPLGPAALARGDAHGLALGIAAFLLALHRFPPAEAEALGLPGPPERAADVATLGGDVLPVLHDALTHEEYRAVGAWWADFAADEQTQRFRPTLIHGDLWYGNILADATAHTVTGLLDFEQAALGDPALDFALQRYLGVSFADRVLAAYRAAGGVLDPDLPHRLRRHWELREFEGVRVALRDDRAELADAIRKLRRGPILALHARP